ncbi:hypothetical protein AB0758_48905 [Tolypothrix bouteillei VB521301_2]|uniref:DinB/UmuC family translesion DNA polymerase n=1 Tax=Tolypothrix bouteillei TaxID=1246981 RepID=UPI0038B60AEA
MNLVPNPSTEATASQSHDISPITVFCRPTRYYKALFEAIDMGKRGVRLLGISLSKLDNVKSDNPIQLSLFE